MSNPFDSGAMAEGYARARPAVHGLILERALERGRVYEWALDVGCGSGVSTRALEGWARQVVGIEPSVAMVRQARAIVPWAGFVAGAAEALPFEAGRFDLLTAAGSLNYVRDLGASLREAARVLRAGGELVVYDFAAGRRWVGGSGLEEWFAEFQRRYPAPAQEALYLDPEVLGREARGWRVAAGEEVEAAVAMTAEAYVRYMMTETNVAAAVRRGEAEAEIRRWCEETVDAAWGSGQREVAFHGYFARLSPVRG